MASPVIDVHTHMLTREWVDLLAQHGKPRYEIKEVRGGLKAVSYTHLTLPTKRIV